MVVALTVAVAVWLVVRSSGPDYVVSAQRARVVSHTVTGPVRQQRQAAIPLAVIREEYGDEIVIERGVYRANEPARYAPVASKEKRQTDLADTHCFLILELQDLPVTVLDAAGNLPEDEAFVMAGEEKCAIMVSRVRAPRRTEGSDVDYQRNSCMLVACVPRPVRKMSLHLPNLKPIRFRAEGTIQTELDLGVVPHHPIRR